MNKIFLIFALLFSFPAAAGGGGGATNIVYDPTNHAENMVTAARSVYAETQRATQIYNQLMQYRHMLMQAQGMNPTVLADLLGQNGQDMRAMQTYIGGMTRLIDDTTQLRELAVNRALDWSRSGLTFDDYAQREGNRIAAGDRRRAQLVEQHLSVMASVNRDVEFVQTVQQKIPGATASQSAEIMNSQLNRIVAQNAALIQLGAADRASQNADRTAREAQTQDQERLMRDAADKRNQTIRAEIDRLSQHAQQNGGAR